MVVVSRTGVEDEGPCPDDENNGHSTNPQSCKVQAKEGGPSARSAAAEALVPYGTISYPPTISCSDQYENNVM